MNTNANRSWNLITWGIGIFIIIDIRRIAYSIQRAYADIDENIIEKKR